MTDFGRVDVGITLLRISIGLTLAAHGYGKFRLGGRLAGTGRWFETIGMRPGWLHARLAATTEVTAGLLMALGLLTPLAAAAFVALMLVAAWTVHRHNGFFIVASGWEYNMILAVAAVVVAIIGPGRFSLDHLWLSDGHLGGIWSFVIAAGGGLLAGAGQLVAFYHPAVDVSKD
jgi:putative oxidoreductase